MSLQRLNPWQAASLATLLGWLCWASPLAAQEADTERTVTCGDVPILVLDGTHFNRVRASASAPVPLNIELNAGDLENAANTGRPALSYDGRWLAYVSGVDLWLYDMEAGT